jgi:hypothetical protein
MTESVTNRSRENGALVNLHNPCEVACRCERWRRTEADLRSAMRITGSVVAATIEACLKSQGLSR